MSDNSDNIVDFAGTRERRTEDATKRGLQDWLPEVQEEVRDRYGRSENSDDPVTPEDLAKLAMERFEKARQALRRVQLASKPRRSRPDPARLWDRINRCGESLTKEIIDDLEVVRLALVANDPGRALFGLKMVAKDLAAGMKQAAEAEERARRSVGARR